MNKTINFTDEDIEIIEKWKEKIGVNSFSEAVRSFIRSEDVENKETTLSEEYFALIADAIKTLNDKIDIIGQNIAPKNVGEIFGKKKK